MEKEMRKLGADFSQSALRPNWESLDAAGGALLDDILGKAAAAGIPGFAVPEAAGGSGLGAAEYSVFIEEVSRACGGAGVLLSAHFAGIAPLLLAGGANANALLSGVTEAEGRGRAALFTAALKESASAEFVSENIETSIDRTAAVCEIDGTKTKVAAGGVAEWFTVLARDNNGGALCWVAVPRDTIGVEVRPESARLGLRICPINDVVFRRAEVPAENVIMTFTGKEKLLDFHRFTDPVLAAVAIGMASEAFDTAMKYSLERYQGGKMICGHDVVGLLLFNMEMNLRASRSLAYGPDAGFLSAAFAARAAENVCLDAVQVLGGYGYMRDYRVERLLRDVKAFAATLDYRARGLEYIGEEIEKLK